MPGWNWQKIRQMLSNILRLNFCFLKIIDILYPRYHLKIIEHILKNKWKNKCVCDYAINYTENKMKMKNRSHRYNINRPRSRNEYKDYKYKNCHTMMMLICINPFVRNAPFLYPPKTLRFSDADEFRG